MESSFCYDDGHIDRSTWPPIFLYWNRTEYRLRMCHSFLGGIVIAPTDIFSKTIRQKMIPFHMLAGVSSVLAFSAL